MGFLMTNYAKSLKLMEPLVPKVIADKYSGRSKGFGFVEMDDDNEARAAIEDLDGAEIDGRSCKVNEARPREERPRRDNFRR